MYSSKNPEKMFVTVLNIDNNNYISWARNQHIRMISEASHDAEYWSNDAGNTALIIEISYSLTYIQIESSYFK